MTQHAATRDNVGKSEKAGDWTLALALSLTDPGHVSLLGLSPGQSSGESGDLSSLASAGALGSFGPGPGCLRWVEPHISVTWQESRRVKTAPWENAPIEP